MPALYDVTVRTPYGHKTHKLAVVKAVRAATPYGGNWFKGAADFLTPDKAAIRAALPHYWRKAFDRNPTCWHTSESLHAHMTLHGYRGQVLATIACDGYERE